MSVIDKAIAAVTPPESEEARIEARKKAESIATPGNWLAQIIAHHREIESQFADLKMASSPDARRAALKQLALLLTAHSIAEEAAVYPAMAANHEVGQAELAYQEQSAAKMEMGLLERLDPESQDFHDKLGHIEGAVKHHVYSEEGTWFIDLARMPATDQTLIQQRYSEEYARYFGDRDRK
jgi:hemerythrin superfamily protein